MLGPRPGYLEALAAVGVLDRLRRFDPHVAGTPPLGVDLPTSDIDVLCAFDQADRFARVVWDSFSHFRDFRIWQWIGDRSAIVARFNAAGWAFEVFGQPTPVRSQLGWRHFEIERRLLAISCGPLRRAVLAARLEGQKTEPAFASVLGLVGDPYLALLELEALSDPDLRALLAARQLAPHEARGGASGPGRPIVAEPPHDARWGSLARD